MVQNILRLAAIDWEFMRRDVHFLFLQKDLVLHRSI